MLLLCCMCVFSCEGGSEEVERGWHLKVEVIRRYA